MDSTILVTGAAGGTQGATGNRLTRLLRENGAAVRAFVRQADERSAALERVGAEIVHGDLLDIASVRHAMRGIERVYFCYPVKEGALEATGILAQVAKEAGVKFVFHLSLGAATDQSPSPWGRKAWLTERMLDWAGIPNLHLRAAPFYENLFRQFAKGIEQSSEIQAPFGTGEGKVPGIAAQDVARFAAIALQSPERFAGLSPQLFTAAFSLKELAEELTLQLGRPVRYREISSEQWSAAALEREGSANLEGRVHLMTLWKLLLQVNQSTEFQSRMVQALGQFRQLTGVEPISLREWLEENRPAIDTRATVGARHGTW